MVSPESMISSITTTVRSFNVLGEADELFDLAGALHALVTGKAHKRNFCGNVDAAHEVGGKHEGAVEYGEKQRILPFEVATNLLCHFGNAFAQARFGG